ncbi:GNAT family N-acetyltransferase [Arthrobacter burdickii]|uniref:GNAT family N-acetyltransferase n=1 Tax=Arthrobacter burdickii TaxID=3035920 RepID=A0ABT8K658_9MICC|nr:GNAT family N-acetyltransferase [Arthrobacter burdickii]MDN4611819.1 GNAT family N-acetyltransferase [Arthrobacter burdickii]
MGTPEDEILIVADEEQARRCFPAFHELRPHLDEDTFVARWREQSSTGYQIVAIEADGRIVAAAGFRELTTMAWGRILYLDDLIALPEHRGHGYGGRLLRHLQHEAIRRGCDELHLDTGYTRHDAHRSYLRNGFDLICHHMAWRGPQA